MKKPIIKNWIKYWTTTIAVSGMLALGACDNNGNQSADNTTDNIETTTEETVTSTRENVNQGIEEVETETEQLTNEEQENNADEPQGATGYQQSGAEQDQDPSQADTRVKADTERRQTDTIVSDSPGGNNYGSGYQENNTELTGSEGQQGQTGTDNNTSENQEGSSAQQGNTGTMDNQQGTPPQGTPTGNQNIQGQDQAVEYDTDRQGTTEMNIRNNNQGNQQETRDTREGGTENDAQQGTQPGTVEDSQGETYNHPGNTTDQESPSDLYTPEDEQLNQDNPQRENINTNQEGTSNVPQSNNTMDQELDANTPASIYERHIATYPEGLSEYAQQRYNEIMEDYKERRQSMQGQVNEETGAQVAAEVDPQPTVGFDELKNIIQRNIDYPRTAAAAKVEGVAFVNLTVDEEGNIEEANAIDEFIEASSDYPQSFTEQDIESAKEDLKEEAERAVKETSGLWEAAEQNGQKVKSEIQIPVRFIVEDMGIGEHKDMGTGVGNPTDVKTPMD